MFIPFFSLRILRNKINIKHLCLCVDLSRSELHHLNFIAVNPISLNFVIIDSKNGDGQLATTSFTLVHGNSRDLFH